MTQIAARARVHGGHQLELRRISGLAGGARNVDFPRFQRLAQHFQHAAVEFGQLIQKQYAVMRQRNFAGFRIGTAAHQCRRAGGMVRIPKRAARVQVQAALLAGQQGAQRPHAHQFVIGQRRQDGRQPLRQHGFACAGWPHHQQAVSARRGNFQR